MVLTLEAEQVPGEQSNRTMAGRGIRGGRSKYSLVVGVVGIVCYYLMIEIVHQSGAARSRISNRGSARQNSPDTLGGPPWALVNPCGSSSKFDVMNLLPPGYPCSRSLIRRQHGRSQNNNNSRAGLDGPITGPGFTKAGAYSNSSVNDRSSGASERIYGISLDRTDIPYFAVMNLHSKDGRRARCNGVLIHQDAVLTSAACVENSEPLKAMDVILGVEESKRFAISYYCKMSDFKNEPGNYKYDVAIVRLAKRPDFQQIGLDVPCMDFAPKLEKAAVCLALTEGIRDCNFPEYLSSFKRSKALLLTQNCPKEVEKKYAKQGRLCFSHAKIDGERWPRIKKANFGSLCKYDYGAPIFCKIQCGFDESKMMLASTFSFPVASDDSELDCNYTNDVKVPMIGMDFGNLGGEFKVLFEKCGLGYKVRSNEPDNSCDQRIYLETTELID